MLSSLWERHAADSPDRTAIIAGGRTISWGELAVQVRRLAGGLHEQGVVRGQAVGIWMSNGPALVASIAALARLGAAAMPVAPDAKPRELLNALDSAGCRLLLAEDSRLETGRTLVAQRPDLRIILETQKAMESATLHQMLQGIDPGGEGRGGEQDAALQLFTSGTTGIPRRILRTQRQLASLAGAYVQAAGLTREDRIHPAIPLWHGHGICSGLLASFQSGAALHLESVFNRRRTLELLGNDRITFFATVPFVLSILADTPTAGPLDLSSIRLAITGGEELRMEIWNKVRDRLGLLARQSYGCTEIGAVAINMDPDPQASAHTVGRPLPGVEISILDSQNQQLPAGQTGEVAVRAAAAGGDNWIRTGDRGNLDEQGRLILAGRIRPLINVAGRKVTPEEIEAVLLSHPGVREAVVRAERDGHGTQIIAAQVGADESCTMAELMAHCREQLADFKIPRRLEIHRRLSRNAAGKISQVES